MFSNAKRFFRLQVDEQGLILFAILYGLFFAFLNFILPFRRLSFFFGKQGLVDIGKNILEDTHKIKNVAKTISRIKRYFPIRFKCLTLALTAKYLLKKMKLQSTLYIGVSNDGQKNLNAHAWLECGGITVTGKEEKSMFTPIVFFT